MSNHSESNEPSKKSYAVSVATFCGVLLLFLLIITVAYLPNMPQSVNEDIIKERKAKLAEVNAKQRELVTSYEWVDKAENVVRIPVERAMQLTVKDLQDKKSILVPVASSGEVSNTTESVNN